MFLSAAAATLLLSLGAAGAATTDSHRVSPSEACTQIENAISSKSAVFHSGFASFNSDNEHYAVTSSEQSTCSVEPGTAKDVGVILQILGKTRTPFAVKGGGHALHPGFSSTTGVQISMSRFNDTVYDKRSQTAVVGAGKTWDQVYIDLAPQNVTVIGGRVPGVGVSGFSLGGGYSYESNQYGLSIDNIIEYELVLPSGKVTTVNARSNPDLSWALKGGFNNYGIVTKFTMKTHPQGPVWGTIFTVGTEHIDEVTAATANFTNDDPKSSAIMEYLPVEGKPGAQVILFYNAPEPAPGVFDAFLKIPTVTTAGGKTMTYVDWLTLNIIPAFPGIFTYTMSVPVFDAPFLEAIRNETEFWGPKLQEQSGTFVIWDVEPFSANHLSFAPESSSAWPPSRAKPFYLLLFFFQFNDPSKYDAIRDIAFQSGAQLTNFLRGRHQALSFPYPNYADQSATIESMYGKSLPRLRALRKRYDPKNVMGLTGGWKF